MCETRAIYRLADAAYAPFSCPASAECCQLGVTGRQPYLWPSEWLLLKDAAHRALLRAGTACPFLENGRCSVYADRPFGCRTFFCHRRSGPSREPVETVAALSKRLEAVNLELDPDARPRALLEWTADAL